MIYNIYLVFHRKRLAAICSSSSKPEVFLYSWVKKKGMLNLLHEFSVAVWDPESNARGGIDVIYFPDSNKAAFVTEEDSDG